MYPGDNKFVFSADTIPICICSNLRLQKVNLIYDSNNMAFNRIPRSNSRYLEIYIRLKLYTTLPSHHALKLEKKCNKEILLYIFKY